MKEVPVEFEFAGEVVDDLLESLDFLVEDGVLVLEVDEFLEGEFELVVLLLEHLDLLAVAEVEQVESLDLALELGELGRVLGLGGVREWNLLIVPTCS